MDNQKFEAILNRLLELSEEEKLNWKSTGNSYKYLLTLNDSSITISSLVESIVAFEFKNEKGETVESMTITRIDEKLFNKSIELYDLVRRKALNSDKTIDRILEQLSPDSITA